MRGCEEKPPLLSHLNLARQPDAKSWVVISELENSSARAPNATKGFPLLLTGFGKTVLKHYRAAWLAKWQ